jgi:hypothetical protein
MLHAAYTIFGQLPAPLNSIKNRHDADFTYFLKQTYNCTAQVG